MGENRLGENGKPRILLGKTLILRQNPARGNGGRETPGEYMAWEENPLQRTVRSI